MRICALLLCLICLCAHAERLQEAIQQKQYPYFTLDVPANMKLSITPLLSTHIINNRAYPSTGGMTYEFKYVKNTKNSATFRISYTPQLAFLKKTFKKPRSLLTTMINQIRRHKETLDGIDKYFTPMSVDERRIKVNHIEYHTTLIKYKSKKNIQKAMVIFFLTSHNDRIFSVEILSRGESHHGANHNMRIMIDMMNSLRLVNSDNL